MMNHEACPLTYKRTGRSALPQRITNRPHILSDGDKNLQMLSCLNSNPESKVDIIFRNLSFL